MTEERKTYYDTMPNPMSYMRGVEGVSAPSRKWLAGWIKDGDSVLDVGAGPGCTYESLVVVHKKDIEYRGIDNTRNFVTACKEAFPKGDFRFGNACALEEPDSSWDVVILRHVLENTPGYREPISEAFRVARKLVIIVMWKDLVAYADVVTKLTWGCYESKYNKEQFLAYLQSFKVPVSYNEFKNCKGYHDNYGWILHKWQ